jgi:hypothetical protein
MDSGILVALVPFLLGEMLCDYSILLALRQGLARAPEST